MIRMEKNDCFPLIYWSSYNNFISSLVYFLYTEENQMSTIIIIEKLMYITVQLLHHRIIDNYHSFLK